MNILRKYTRRSMGLSKSRTLVTIIGIVLSMALLTAVIEGAYSGMQYMVRNEEANSGRWEAYFSGMDEEKLAKLKKDPEVADIMSWNSVGVIESGSGQSYGEYLFVTSVTEEFYDMVAVNIVRGRLPENENEIVLPHNMGQHLGDLDLAIGNIINVSVGTRVDASGNELGLAEMREGEKVIDTTQHSYTVVGIYNRLNSSIISYNTPGYIALTVSDEGKIMGSFATLKHPSDAYTFQRTRSNPDSSEYISKCSLHSDLLNMKGTVRNGRIQQVIYSLAAILVLMIAFGSISLIYNSFSISLAERTKQFGILKSVGATKKQLLGSVLYEALTLGGIGIPIGLILGCASIGITLYLLKDFFKAFSITNSVQIRLVISPLGLLIAIIVCLVVILISAWIPAKRAIRIQPIEAIRQNANTKVKAREVRTSKLTMKLFGFEGTMASKNFKRNAKRYRATIISLFMSIVLFISASSFCSYLTDSVEGIVSDGANVDVAVYDYNYSGSSREMLSAEKFSSLISGISGIDSFSYVVNTNGNAYADPSLLSEKYWELQDQSSKQEAEAAGEEVLYASIIFVNDDEFKEILKENGLKESDYFNASAPKAVLYNKQVAIVDTSKGNKFVSFELLKKNVLPAAFEHRTLKEMDGYIYKFETDDNGKRIVVYYPDEYYEQMMIQHNYDLDRTKGIVKSYKEATYATELHVAAEVNTVPMMFSSKEAGIIYPYSMLDHVFADEAAREQAVYGISFGIKTMQSNTVSERLQEIIDENNLGLNVRNIAESRNTERMIVTVVNVFAYGFIIVISLIALANVFNTVSTSIMLRRREFAMLKSIGLSERGFSKMMNFECVIYGLRSLLFGLPVAVAVTYVIWRATSEAFETGFYLPAKGIIIAVASVFIVVFATMLYATRRIRKDNPIDALRNENL